MSFWPGRGLFASRHKRHPRIRVVWRPPEKLNVTDSIDAIDDQPKKELPGKDVQSQGSKSKNNQDKSSSSKQGDKKSCNYEKKSNRGRKRRNVKPISDQSNNSDGSEKMGNKSHEIEGKDEDDEIGDEKGLSEASTGDIPVAKKKARKKRFGRRSKKSIDRDASIICANEDEIKLNKIHGDAAGGSEDHLDRLERDWEDGGDSGGQISRCSSSSSLSSSCSHHSLIKHYTNIMMNCCDNQYDEDCNVVKNKIDRILKSQWKDRLNRSKDKPIGSSESQSPISQAPALKHSPSFKLRPARLPLNKKTWSKLKKSNQNSDWLFNNES